MKRKQAAMGKNNRVKKNKHNGLYLDERTLKKAEKEFSKKVREEWREETEERLRLIYAVAERNAFLKNMYVTFLTNRDVFGHGKSRLERAAEHMIFQYECIEDGHVTLEDMISCIKAETGVDISFSTAEINEILEYGFKHGIEGVKTKFHDMKVGVTKPC